MPRLLSKKTHQKGFSLIELLIVAALIPVISFAIYFSFRSSTELWKRLVQEIPEEEIAIFNWRSEGDFRQAFHYSAVPFFGSEEEVSFACYIHTDPHLGGDHGIGQARYFYDSDKKLIVREEKNVSQLYAQKGYSSKVLLQHIESFQLSFLFKDREENKFKWRGDWPVSEKYLPIAVQFNFTQDQSGTLRSVNKVFEIPAGGNRGSLEG